jgi:hypothetical protein
MIDVLLRCLLFIDPWGAASAPMVSGVPLAWRLKGQSGKEILNFFGQRCSLWNVDSSAALRYAWDDTVLRYAWADTYAYA